MASRNRGRDKLNLRKYTALLPEHEELAKIAEGLKLDQHHILLAVTGQTVVEGHLEKLLRRKLAKKDEETWVSLVHEPGPLASFNKKVMLADALGVIDEATKGGLLHIGKIRNSIVHSKKPLDFTHDLIRDEFRKIPLPKNHRLKAYKDIQKLRGFADIPVPLNLGYILLCYFVANRLLDKELKYFKAKTRRAEKRAQREMMISALLVGTPESPGGFLSGFLKSQISDPKAQSPDLNQTGDSRPAPQPSKKK